MKEVFMISNEHSKGEKSRQPLKGNKITFKQKSRLIRSLGATLILFISGLILFPLKSTGVNSPAPASSQVVAYSQSQFADGKAKYFHYKTPAGKTVRYFIVRSSDGVIRAAFDACDVCWPANKGYYQEGDFMICKNCGKRFPTAQVNVVQGGCNPAPLKRQIAGNQLILQVKDILAGETYFNF